MSLRSRHFCKDWNRETISAFKAASDAQVGLVVYVVMYERHTRRFDFCSLPLLVLFLVNGSSGARASVSIRMTIAGSEVVATRNVDADVDLVTDLLEVGT